MSKGWFQGKPRQEGPWCALKESPNRKEAFILRKRFQATWSWNEHSFNCWSCNQINRQCSWQTQRSIERLYSVFQVQIFQIKWSYVVLRVNAKRQDKEKNVFLLNIIFKTYYIIFYQIENILQFFSLV